MTYDEVSERRVIERYLRNTTSVPLSQQLSGDVAATHADSLGQDLLQLRRSTARDESSDQSQRVVVEIRLQSNLNK